MIDFIDKKQMYDSGITEKVNASKEWINALKLLSGFFWLFLGQGLPFLVKTGWQPYLPHVTIEHRLLGR